MIRTWGFYIFMEPTFPRPEDFDPDTCQRTYDRYLDLWARCEGWGFDGLAFAEHHFSSLNLSPSPHLLVAAVAARTTRLRFTTLGAVLPLYDGRRYAEECGMLDYLTGGRFEPGIAPGVGPLEAGRAGIPADEVRPRYHSAAEVLEQSLSGPFVTHHDDFHDLERVPIVPRMRTPRPPVWVTVMSPDSAAWTARRGYKMCTAWSSTETAGKLAATYREAAGEAGGSTDPAMLGVRRRVFVAPTDAEAQDIAEAAGNLVQSSAGSTFETQDDRIRRMMNHPDDFAIGSPETVAEKLIEQCRHGGFGHVMAFPDFLLFRHEDLVRSHELIGTKVAPLLRAARVAAPEGAPAAPAPVPAG